MALCDSCQNYDKSYDEFRQNYDDVIIENGDKRQKHYCNMYDDHIPFGIFYENENCVYYRQDHN